MRVDHHSGADGDTLQATIESFATAEPGTDLALLRAGHPTLTELRSVSEVPGVLDGIRVGARRAG